ncbi:hypothetical protein T492DRAFT_858120 [Pavlovales sp. CCMP2436]|nr:hypothetical protein T492DRAFT_858120 [Pavlovales sp. CCMP2436]
MDLRNLELEEYCPQPDLLDLLEELKIPQHSDKLTELGYDDVNDIENVDITHFETACTGGGILPAHIDKLVHAIRKHRLCQPLTTPPPPDLPPADSSSRASNPPLALRAVQARCSVPVTPAAAMLGRKKGRRKRKAQDPSEDPAEAAEDRESSTAKGQRPLNPRSSVRQWSAYSWGEVHGDSQRHLPATGERGHNGSERKGMGTGEDATAQAASSNVEGGVRST